MPQQVYTQAQPEATRGAQMDLELYRASFVRQRRFGSLDGLRAISIIAVIWSHGPGQSATWPLLRSGRRGVDLFFAISGFLITTLLLRERESAGRISLRRFYARRSLRIFPLYYGVLLLYAISALIRPQSSSDGHQFLLNLKYFATYTTNWFVAPAAVFGFAWSLATEEQFYCCWPSVEKYCGRWAAPAMAGLLGIVLAIQRGWVPAAGIVRTAAFSVAAPICFGVLLAHLLHHPRGYRLGLRCLGFHGAPLAAFAIASATIGMGAHNFVIALSLTLIVGTCVVREDHWLGPVLSYRRLAQAGEVSYGMYLLHGFSYHAIDAAATGAGLGPARQGLPAFFGAALLTLLLATLCYRYYESFFLQRKKRFAALKA